MMSIILILYQSSSQSNLKSVAKNEEITAAPKKSQTDDERKKVKECRRYNHFLCHGIAHIYYFHLVEINHCVQQMRIDYEHDGSFTFTVLSGTKVVRDLP